MRATVLPSPRLLILALLLALALATAAAVAHGFLIHHFIAAMHYHGKPHLAAMHYFGRMHFHG